MPANARVVGASGGQSNQVVTVLSSATSTLRKNGVWHSGTGSMPAWPASSGGNAGTASEYSSSISSTTSRGAVRNSSTISASLGGIAPTLVAFRRDCRLVGMDQVTHGDDADELALGVGDQHPADPTLPHQVGRLPQGRGL